MLFSICTIVGMLNFGFFFNEGVAAQRFAQSQSRHALEQEYYAHSVQAVPRDAFPVLMNPSMSEAVDGDKFLRPKEWVIGVDLNDEAKAYPITVMGTHELINDTVGGQPVAICW